MVMIEKLVQSLFFFVVPQIFIIPLLFFVIVHVQTFYESLGGSFRDFLIVIAVSRAIDVLFDPYMGHISDNFLGGKWGGQIVNETRLRYILGGSVLFSIALILLLAPPTNSQTKYTIWFAFSYILFMVGYSVLYLPYTGLLFSVPHSKLKGSSSGDVNVRIAEQVTGFKYRDVMCFAMGMLEMMGLLALFLISGIVPKDPSSSACSSGSCLSAKSGVWAVGYSCLPNPSSGLTEQYKIFNTTAWYMRHPTVVKSKTTVLVSPGNYSCKSYHGNYYSDPNKLFTPNNCAGFHSDSNKCMQTYCSCIAECSGLCLTKKMSSAYLALGVCFGIVSLLCVASVCVKVMWKLATSSGTSNAATADDDSNSAAAITSYSGTDYTAVAVDSSDTAVNAATVSNSGNGIVNSSGNANATNHLRDGVIRNHSNEVSEQVQDGSDVDTEEGTQAPNITVRRSIMTKFTDAITTIVDTISIDVIRAVQFNKLFRTFLPIWTLDTLSHLMFVCNLGYFVRYVTEPEYSIISTGTSLLDCNNGISIPRQESDSWQCKSTAVTGFALAMLMLAGMMSCPVWYMTSLWVGKIKTWQAASFLQCFLYFVLGFSLDRGLVNRTIAFCGVIGIGAGSWFLNDSIFLDIIDYDEFLTQRRNEGFFLCLRPLLLKLCSIPAMVGPLAGLYFVGYQPPVNYVIQKQNENVKLFCALVVILGPFLFSLVSSVLKVKFRLELRGQVDMIYEGIKYHKENLPAPDPLSGEMFPKRFYTADEEARAKAFDMFPSLEVALDALTCIEAESPRVAVKLIFDRMRDWFLSVVIVAVLSLVGVILTSQMFFFRTQILIGLFVIPVLMIICLGASMTLFAFSYRRIKNANELLKPGGLPSVALMDKICKNRAMLIEMRDSKLPPSEVITLGKERLLQMLESTKEQSSSAVEVEPPIDHTDHHFENSKEDDLTLWDVEMYSFLYEQSTGQSLFAHQRQQELRQRRSMRVVKAKDQQNMITQSHSRKESFNADQQDGSKKHKEEEGQVSDNSSMYDNISDFDDDEEAAAAILDDQQLADLAKARNINISVSLNHAPASHSTSGRAKDGWGHNDVVEDDGDDDQLAQLLARERHLKESIGSKKSNYYK